jgi:hypothetical protein
MPVRRVTPINIDLQVWETVRTIEPALAAAQKKCTELSGAVKDLREKCDHNEGETTTLQQTHEVLEKSHNDLKEYTRSLQRSHDELKSAYDETTESLKRRDELVDALLARVTALEARSSVGCSMVSDHDEAATLKPDLSSSSEETVQRKWVDNKFHIPPPLPQDLGRTPPRATRDLAVLEMKTPAEQENGPGNITVVKKRPAGNARCLRPAPGTMHHDYEGRAVSASWLRQNFGVPTVPRY